MSSDDPKWTPAIATRLSGLGREAEGRFFEVFGLVQRKCAAYAQHVWLGFRLGPAMSRLNQINPNETGLSSHLVVSSGYRHGRHYCVGHSVSADRDYEARESPQSGSCVSCPACGRSWRPRNGQECVAETYIVRR